MAARHPLSLGWPGIELEGLCFESGTHARSESHGRLEQREGQRLGAARAAGVSRLVFGDLFLADVRAYREAKMAGTGIEPVFPLWGRDTARLARDMLAGGLQATLTCIDPRCLDRSFAGRAFDKALLASLPAGVDPCGENGEFHTFVSAGPMFRAPLEVVVGEVVEREGFVFADVLPVSGAALPLGPPANKL